MISLLECVGNGFTIERNCKWFYNKNELKMILLNKWDDLDI